MFEEARDISGGASADVGDIWFEISTSDWNRWEVSASVPVHCDLMPRGYACMHELYDEQPIAESPEKAIEALAALVADVRKQLPRSLQRGFTVFRTKGSPANESLRRSVLRTGSLCGVRVHARSRR